MPTARTTREVGRRTLKLVGRAAVVRRLGRPPDVRPAVRQRQKLVRPRPRHPQARPDHPRQTRAAVARPVRLGRKHPVATGGLGTRHPSTIPAPRRTPPPTPRLAAPPPPGSAVRPSRAPARAVPGPGPTTRARVRTGARDPRRPSGGRRRCRRCSRTRWWPRAGRRSARGLRGSPRCRGRPMVRRRVRRGRGEAAYRR